MKRMTLLTSFTLLVEQWDANRETQHGLDCTSQERADVPLKTRKEGHRLSQADAHLAASISLLGL